MKQEMNLWEAIEGRRSIRSYDPTQELPEDVIEKILKMATLSPSAGNLQAWFFYVIKNKKIKRGLVQAAYGQEFLAEAPVNIVVCADPDRSGSKYGSRGRELYCLQDTAIAIQNIMLSATALGLGTCCVGAFDEEEARNVLNLPQGLRPVAIIALGHSRESPGPRPRRDLKEVVKVIK